MPKKSEKVERNQEIIHLLNSGFTTTKVAEMYGITPPRVRQISLASQRKEQQNIFDKRIAACKKNGLSIQETADWLGTHSFFLRFYLKHRRFNYK